MKKSTVVIALLAVLAIVFGILFITGNNEKNDLQAKVDELNTVVKSAADQGKIDLDSAVAAAKEEAEAATTKAVEDAVAAAKAEGETALNDAVAAAKAEGETALADAKAAAEQAVADAKAEGEKALADAKTAAEETLANVKAEGEKALADAKAAAEQAVADAKAEGEKALEAAKAEDEAALKSVQDELETWKTKAADLEAQIAAAATAATEKVEEVKEAAAEVVENATEAVTEKAEEVKEAAAEVVENATAAVEEKAEEAAEAVAEGAEAVEAAVEEAAVIDHAAYAAAELDTKVVIETTVQATQSWWDDKITVYAQSEDGAYFIYNMACSKEDAEKLVPGTKIKVQGFKSEWSGEVEIVDGTFEFLEGEGFKAEAFDATDLLGKDELIEHQNELVAFKGVTVEAYDESGAAFAYKNAENKTDDLYFKVSKDGATYDFCVEFYLCGQDTEVYKAVEALNVGDVVDLEGFLYWYNGANPHITKVTAAQ